MTLSAAFTVNGVANPLAHAVAYGATVTLQLTSLTGVNSVVWEILATSHASMTAPTLTPSGALGSTCTFTQVADPGGGEGRSVLVRCTVTSSIGEIARQGSIVGTANVNSIVPGVPGETTERNGTHGWASIVNTALGGTATVADNAITNAKLRDSVPLSVIGRGSNTDGDPADIPAADADTALRRVGTTLAFGKIDAGHISLTSALACGNQALTGVLNVTGAVVDDGNSGAADTINWSAGGIHTSTLTGNVTYTFTAPQGPTTLVLKIVQDGTGGRTITWPASVKNAPTLTTTASTTSIVSFFYDGTNYWAALGCTGVA